MHRTLRPVPLLFVVLLAFASVGADAQDDEPVRLHELRVLVTDTYARPLAGVRVTARPVAHRPPNVQPPATDPLAALYEPPERRNRAGEGVLEGVTAEDGSFRFQQLAAEVDHAIEAHPSAPDVAESQLVKPAEEGASPCRLVVRRGEWLRGRVVDAEGKGLHAWVDATSNSRLGWPYGWRGRRGWRRADARPTDADGRFTFPVPLGDSVQLTVLVPGRWIWSGMAVAGEDEVLVRVGIADGARAHGTVCDDAGAPILGARVVALLESGDWPYERPYLHALAMTDEEGRWALDRLPRGRILALFSGRAGFVLRYLAGLSIPLDSGASTPIDVTLTRPPTLTGRVLDAEFRPVPGAEVYAAGGLPHIPFLRPGIPSPALTGPEGRYTVVSHDSTARTVSAQPPGWTGFLTPTPRRGSWPHPAPQRPGDLDVVVPRAGSVRGVARSVDGTPLSGVTVHVGAQRHDVTDAEGVFAVRGVGMGATLLLVVRKPGWWSPYRSVLVEAANPDVEVDLVLQPAGVVEGRVRDERGQGLGRLEVRASPPRAADEVTDETASGAPSHYATSDHAGGFRFDDLPPGAPIRIHLRGRPPEEGVLVTPSAAEPPQVEIVRPTGEVLSGRVVDPDGRGVPHVTVALAEEGVEAEVRTDAIGRFAFTHLPAPADPGGYRLRLRWTTLDSVYPPGTTDAVLGFEKEPIRFFEGLVLLPDGSPVPWALARRRATPGGWQQVQAGWFRVFVGRDVEEIGVAVRDPRDAIGRRFSFRRAVYEGTVPTEPVVFRLEPGLRVTGRLLDLHGEPVAKREVSYVPQNAAWYEAHTPYVATTAADGRFEIMGAREGEGAIHLKADLLWWDEEPRSCRAGDEDVELRTRRIVGVRGRVTASDGEPLEGARVIATLSSDEIPRISVGSTWRATTDAAGRFELERIPDGAIVDVRVARLLQSDAVFFGASIEAVVAGPEELAITLVRAATVRGVVQDEHGEPMVGVPVQAAIPDPDTRALANAARLDARTDAQGHFVIGPLPPSARVDLDLPHRAGGNVLHLGARVVGVVAGTDDLVIRVRRGVALRGILMGNDEQPIPGARIRLEPWYAEDHERPRRSWRGDGKEIGFGIEGLYPGRYRLTIVLAQPEYVLPEPFEVDVPRSDLVIQLTRAHPVRGRVLGDVRHARIRFVPDDDVQDDSRHRTHSVSGDGSFVLPNEHDAPGTLVVETRDGRFDVRLGVRPSMGPFELDPKPGVRIAGRIDGLPRGLGRRVRVQLRLRLGSLVYETGLDRVDAFRFSDVLPRGRYAVEVATHRMKGRIVGPTAIEGGDEDVRFRYEPAED